MKKTTLIAKETHCAACKALIEDVCKDIKGVKSCNVEYKSGKKEIEHDNEFDINFFKKKQKAWEIIRQNEMTHEYSERLSELIKRTNLGKLKNVKLEVKHFFSGAAVYANSSICITLTPVGLAIKLPEQLRNKLIKQKGAKPLRYFPQGPIKKDYAVLSESMLTDIKNLRLWLKPSIEYVYRKNGKDNNKK